MTHLMTHDSRPHIDSQENDAHGVGKWCGVHICKLLVDDIQDFEYGLLRPNHGFVTSVVEDPTIL